jgi:hypothetical protein
LQRRGACRQTAQWLVVDAEHGEHGEAATQRNDRGDHSRDQKTDIGKHSTSHYGRAIFGEARVTKMQIIARADGAASTPAHGPASNGRTLTESAEIQCKKANKNPASAAALAGPCK